MPAIQTPATKAALRLHHELHGRRVHLLWSGTSGVSGGPGVDDESLQESQGCSFLIFLALQSDCSPANLGSPRTTLRLALAIRGLAGPVVGTGYDFEYRTCSNEFEIRRANDCQLLYVHPQPAAQALDIIYPSNYVPFRFNQLRGPARWARDFLQGGKARAIVKLAGMNGKILDVGAGSGVLIRQIARVKGNRENLWANDFSGRDCRLLFTERAFKRSWGARKI